jgi:hypothetical protein
MLENWYFLLSDDNPNIDRIRIECATQHGRNTADNELGESVKDNERLIKVTGGGIAWQNSRDWINSLLHPPLKQGNIEDDLFRADWQNPPV